jgi:unsaturated chondroitin disaccharide hydrolase
MYQQLIAKNQAWIDETFGKLDAKLSKVTLRSRDKIPYTTENGVHNSCTGDGLKGISWWTNGFWAGLNWLMNEATGNEEYRKTAERSEELMDEAVWDFNQLHHDVGFMWHLMSGANYRLTGNKKSRVRNLLAASLLSSRYNLSGGFIRAWNGPENPTWDGPDNVGWTIIDCMMNIPVLYWASRELKDDRFTQIGVSHANMAMRDHVRPDGSVAHICIHDPATGELLGTLGGQGMEEGSSWSRGLSWALYGFILSYIHTRKQEYLDTAKRIAHYYIANAVMDDYLPLSDYRAPEEPVEYDSTAGAISACALIEIAKHVPQHEQKLYLEPAIKTLRAMSEKFCDWSDTQDAVLMMGTEAYNRGVHMPIVYGDFFFAEAICKLKGREFLIW